MALPSDTAVLDGLADDLDAGFERSSEPTPAPSTAPRCA